MERQACMKKIKINTPVWKLVVYPFITFIVVFAVSRSLFPLLKDWTWMATACGCVCGLIAAFVQFLKLVLVKEH